MGHFPSQVTNSAPFLAQFTPPRQSLTHPTPPLLFAARQVQEWGGGGEGGCDWGGGGVTETLSPSVATDKPVAMGTVNGLGSNDSGPDINTQSLILPAGRQWGKDTRSG